MTHAMRARKERGAKIVAIDIYMNATMKQADMALLVRPGTDGALACAVMHVLFRDGYADWDYLDALHRLSARARGASAQPRSCLGIRHHGAFGRRDRGLREARRRATKRTYFRLGYGFGRQRNGVVNMHAASCIAAVTGAWQHEGGGAFHNNGAIYHWRKTLIEGLDARDPERPPARPVADRPRAHRRCRGAAPRPAGDGDADPEHQSGLGRARAGAGEARLRRATISSSACTSSS